MTESFLDGRVVLHGGDCMEVLAGLPENSVHSVVCDPPYHLASIVKRFGGENAAPAKGNAAYIRASKGFMSRVWDGGDIAFQPELWSRVLRVLRPGGHVTAFAATRNYHRMACAIEDAGFEIRDCILDIFDSSKDGAAFLKSLNAEQRGAFLKIADDKSFSGLLAWTFGSGFPKSKNAGNGWGSALKPAFEPICLARKPLSEATIAANVLAHGTGAINIDGCRVGTEPRTTHARGNVRGRPGHVYADLADLPHRESLGASARWPANILHDGSEEVIAAFPETTSGAGGGGKTKTGLRGNVFEPNTPCDREADSGSSSRFFYTAKADADDRLGSKHPTVKPVDLMQWLCRLVTPKGGTVLDPFAGTGTTGEAAFREGFNAVLIERETEYQDDIRRRMALVMAGPDERRRESIKAKLGDLPFEAGSLFA